MQDLLAALAPLEASRLTAASIFTTQERESLMRGIWQAVAELEAPEVDLDLDDDGAADVFLPEPVPQAHRGRPSKGCSTVRS